MSWVYLIVGVVCLVALQSLRAVLSIEFPIYKSSLTPRPDPYKFGGLDLIDVKTASLSALGFAGPEWIGSCESSAVANGVSAHAVYRNEAERVTAWLGPTSDLAQPSQLLSYYTTLLQDGRYAVTQVSDPYFESVEDPQTPAQTIAASDVATELELHNRFVSDLGVPRAVPDSEEGLLHFAGEHMSSIRSRLLDRGRIVESDGTARPSVAFAIKLLRALRAKPKPAAADSSPIPTPRLAFFSNLVSRAKERAPSQQMQWLLLSLSSVLFVAIGWPLLGLEFTLVILGVIAFHETGHWVAMRMFGYRNPHITLLPLLGGVTIGHETEPSAAKRAWVALAGPLPGIVLAWVLVYFAATNLAEAGELGDWLLSTIVVLLFVNYLNVLPIPPLDGSHIVRAILPPRWLAAQTLVVLVGVAMGIYVAYLLEFWPLALIAALQLFSLKSLWRTAGLVNKLSRKPPPGDLDETARTAWLLTELENTLGAPKVAAKRIVLANNILTQLDTKPMAGMQRAVISSVYLALVIVPIAAMALAVSGPLAPEVRPEIEAMNEAIQLEVDELYATTENLDDVTLIKAISSEESPAVPASEDDLEAAEDRLGRELPAHLRDFYTLTNGIPRSLGLARLENVRVANAETFYSGDLMHYVYEGALYFYGHTLGEVVVPVAETEDWWFAGSTGFRNSYVYIDPDARPGEPAIFVMGDGGSSVHETVRDLLRSTWIDLQSVAIYYKYAERLHEAIDESMHELTVAELIGEFPQPGLLERLIAGSVAESGAASPDAIAAAEKKVGHPLPTDYRQMLQIHNGFAPVGLLPIEDIQSARLSSNDAMELALGAANEAHPRLVSEQDIRECWTIAGHFAPDPIAGGSLELFPKLFWCPEMDQEFQFLSLSSNGFQDSFTDALRYNAVLLNSF